jgi:hypothetical protein
VREAVRRGVALRVVERDRSGSEPIERSAQGRADALVVADDLRVRTERLDARCVEAPDDRDPLARSRDQERAFPGAVRARDEVEAGIARERRLAHEGQPEVDVLLAEDLDDLVELLVDDGRL